MSTFEGVDFSDPKLFGNEASELEDENVFFSYAIPRREVEDFASPEHLVQIVSSYKGEGKSGLLRLVKRRLSEHVPSPPIVSAVGADLAPKLDSADPDEWVREWKRAIFSLVAREIGAQVGLAFTDDAISLVEEAERSGYRSRSILSAILDRLRPTGVGVDRERPELASANKLVQRWMSGNTLIWIVVDDIDQNFENTARQRLKVASFFIAVRQIVTAVPAIRFRLAIRPNIWALLIREYEGLSHLRQYLLELTWSEDEICSLLAKRVESHLDRRGLWSKQKRFFSVDQRAREMQLLRLAFDDPMPWGGDTRMRHAHQILYTLSRHRPRWIVELCKVAARAAYEVGRKTIGFDNIVGVLRKFGESRIEDTVAEFRSQCPEVSELIRAFHGEPERYATDQLVKALRNRVLQGVNPHIAGVTGKANERDVAHFLFHIGFLSARRDLGNDKYEHLTYADAPHLFADRTNIDTGVTWEIHPIFRQPLELKNVKP